MGFVQEQRGATEGLDVEQDLDFIKVVPMLERLEFRWEGAGRKSRRKPGESWGAKLSGGGGTGGRDCRERRIAQVPGSHEIQDCVTHMWFWDKQ